MQITEQHVQNVIEISAKVKAEKYHQRKKDLFNQLIAQQDELTKYLFAFCCYHCLFNPRWRIIESSRYFTVSLQETNQATFLDFLKVLKHYENFRVTSRREKVLIKFLQKCDKVHFDFYCSLFDKTFIKDLPLTNVQEHLDLDAVDISEAYTIEELKEQFDELVYPITITTIDTRDADFVIHSVEATRTIQRVLKENDLEIVKNRVLRSEKVYNKFPEYTLVGYIYEVEKEEKNSGSRGKRKGHQAAVHRFVPIDFFEDFKEYNHYFLEKNTVEYSARINRLNDYLATTCTASVKDTFVGFAEKPEDIFPELLKLMTGKEYAYLLFSDANSARLGNTKAVECRKTEGILEDYWVEDEVVKGMLVWFNGILRKVAFNFNGDNNRLLNSIKPIKHKLVSFLYIVINDVEYYFGMEVNLEKKPWLRKSIKHNGIWVEKCACCSGTDYVVDYRGVCRSCAQNMAYFLKNYGPDVWIPPHWFKAKKRKANCWSYTLTNAVKYRYKGYLLEARPDGWWRLATNEESMAEYLAWIEKQKEFKEAAKTKKKKRKRVK